MLFQRTLFRYTAGSVVLGSLVLSVILGPARLSRETRAAVQRVEEAFDQSVSNAQLLANARVTLNDYAVQGHKLEDNLREIDDRIAEARRAISTAEKEQQEHESVLRLAKLKLVSLADAFEINGRTYSRTDVERDADQRLQRCRDAAARIAAEQETLRRLEQIRTDVAGNLLQLRQVREEKSREVELLAARMKNAEVLEQLQSLNLKFDPATGSETKFEQTVAEIERRIRDAERRVAGAANQDQGLIDWTTRQRDLLAEIEAQLAKTPTTQVVAHK